MSDIVDYPAWSRGWDDGPSWDCPTDAFPVIVLKPKRPGPDDDAAGGVRLVLMISLVLIAIAVLGYLAAH